LSRIEPYSDGGMGGTGRGHGPTNFWEKKKSKKKF